MKSLYESLLGNVGGSIENEMWNRVKELIKIVNPRFYEREASNLTAEDYIIKKNNLANIILPVSRDKDYQILTFDKEFAHGDDLFPVGVGLINTQLAFSTQLKELGTIIYKEITLPSFSAKNVPEHIPRYICFDNCEIKSFEGINDKLNKNVESVTVTLDNCKFKNLEGVKVPEKVLLLIKTDNFNQIKGVSSKGSVLIYIQTPIDLKKLDLAFKYIYSSNKKMVRSIIDSLKDKEREMFIELFRLLENCDRVGIQNGTSTVYSTLASRTKFLSLTK